ncbi:MAG TPA: DUF1223 domain-containing protein [Pyrinomonadaceae bacterium]|nr:DUF1223 domain-containing protein [Pyrinomonadaceae bacterium]
MKSVFVFLLCVLLVSCSSQTAESQKITDNSKVSDQPKQFVLLELFTSEGCSSCPPADKNLAFIEKEQPYMQAEVVTLAFHVDYWDYIGWKDVFSSPLYTKRQEIYSQIAKLESTYTPQMIVDGKAQFVGSDAGRAANEIILAAKEKKANVEILSENDKLKIKISDAPKHENSTVYLAISENNLASNVKRGENSGRKLEHSSVVRELKALGSFSPEQNSFEIETNVNLQKDWKKEDVKYVIFVQENESRKIIGVGRINAK